MDLLITPFSELSQVLSAESVANLGKFISGVNTTLPKWKLKENVKAQKNEVGGKVVIILSAKRDILPGDLLRMNYNNGALEKSYPDSDFK